MSNQVSKIKRTGILSLVITFLLFIPFLSAKAQDSVKINKKLYYRVTIGFGVGSGYPLQGNDFGIAGMLEVAIQKNNSLFSLGIRNLEELEIIFVPNVINSIQSIDVTYGRVFKKNAFYNSVSGGLGLVTSVQQGKILPGAGSGLSGGFSSSFFDINNTYEKIVKHTIGFPISAKLFWISSKFRRTNKKAGSGLGIELFININSISTFYQMNFCFQFGN